jgi:hypothetical protein
MERRNVFERKNLHAREDFSEKPVRESCRH